MRTDGNTKIIGFLGSTFKTSKMYDLYNRAFKALNLNYAYIPLIAQNPEKAIAGIRNLGIYGAGVTIPFKETVIPYIDKLDQTASEISAVNAIVNVKGKLTGFNTDGTGAVMALKEHTVIINKNILLLGAGGAAKAIAHALIKEKANLTVVNRTPEPVRLLQKKLGCGIDTLSALPKYIQNSDIIINATSVGMFPDCKKCLVPIKMLRKKMIVMDLVTNPRDTVLLTGAADNGCTVVHGERMLLWQAVLKFELFTGVKPPVKIMEGALHA